VTQLRETNFAFEKTTTILYNDHGDAAKVNMTFGDDEEGNLTRREVSGATPQHLPVPPSKRSTTATCASYGNWTQQTTTRGSGSGTPSGERHRTITCF